MNFYTGLSTISTFSVLFSLFHPNLSNMQYWRGTRICQICSIGEVQESVKYAVLDRYKNLSNMQYWRGTRRHILKSNRKRKFTRSSRKILSYKYGFLLTLMKLRLGLLNEDLADRFGISPAICIYPHQRIMYACE